MIEKKEIPVETDANKLVNYVCGSNILKTGEPIKVKWNLKKKKKIFFTKEK